MEIITKEHEVVMLATEEVWKDIPEYKGKYQASNLGNIKSLARDVNRGDRPYSIKEKLLSVYLDSHDRPCVGLTVEGVTKQKKVYRLVASAFIPNPENKREVNHKDFDLHNSCVRNLEWVTPSENIQHSYDMRNKYCGHTQPFELYFTSDEPIEEGDWCYNDNTDVLEQVFELGDMDHYVSHYKKIIATTDPKLMHSGEIVDYKGVAVVPQSFIESYIKNPVDKVLLEYNERLVCTEGELCPTVTNSGERCKGKVIEKQILKLEDNEVVVALSEEDKQTLQVFRTAIDEAVVMERKIKLKMESEDIATIGKNIAERHGTKLYTKEEVEGKLFDFVDRMCIDVTSRELNDWIKENL